MLTCILIESSGPKASQTRLRVRSDAANGRMSEEIARPDGRAQYK